MYLKKNSPLTPFITYELLKIQQIGVSRNIFLRDAIGEPNCKPLYIPSRSLGFEKTLVLFLILLLGFLSSIIILGLENMWSKSVKVSYYQWWFSSALQFLPDIRNICWATSGVFGQMYKAVQYRQLGHTKFWNRSSLVTVTDNSLFHP